MTARYAQEVGKASLGDSRDSDRTAVPAGRLQTYVADSVEPSVEQMLSAIYAMTPEEWGHSIEEALKPHSEGLGNASPKGMAQSKRNTWQVPGTPARLPPSLHPARHKR